jgi:cbb3-type cytochrome oxidase maturation protein
MGLPGMEWLSAYWLVTLVSFVFLVGGIAAMVWAVRSGQFKDTEGVKYRMLEQDDDELPKS